MVEFGKEKLIGVLIIVSSLFNSCFAQKASEQTEGFDSFYERFHTDTLFQLSRITFPLEGYNYDSNYDPIAKDNSSFAWRKKDWKFHSKLIEEEGLKVELTRKEESVEEVISIPASGIRITREFSLIEGKWHLVFYGNHFL